MSSPIPRILEWSRGHPRLVAAGAACLAAVSALGASRLSFETDVLALLPRTGRVIPAFRTFVEQFGSLDELYVVFTAPDGHDIQEYEDEIDAWVERLRQTPEIARVDTGLIDPSRDVGWLANRQLLLMQDPVLERALGRFQGDGMRAALQTRRSLLALPSPAASEIVRQDPLGLYDLLREQLGPDKGGLGIGAAEAGYITSDGRSRLVIAHPARPPYDTEFSRALFAALERIRAGRPGPKLATRDEEPLPALGVEFAGGHRIAIETESVVRRESVLNTVVSLGLILPLLFLVFRSPWLVAVGPLPAGVSLLCVLGVLGLVGSTLSAAATASAALLFGLGVDGVVLLYVAHTLAVRDGVDGNSAKQLDGSSRSMLLGMWTTAATFYGLTVVDFPSLEQLGLLIGHSMVVCGILTLVLVPAFLPRRNTQPARSLRLVGLAALVHAKAGTIVVIATAATIALGAAALNLNINPTLERLRSVTPGAEVLARVASRFALPHDVYVVAQRGLSLDPLLTSNERLSAAVRQSLPSVPLQPATALLPSASSQRRRADTIRRADLSAGVLATRLDRAAEAEGFKPDSFAPFRRRLPELLAAQPSLTHEAYVQHGLADLIGRFVRRQGDEWLVVSYAFPKEADVAALERLVTETGDGAILTGLPLVNMELAERFVPQFLTGLAVGTVLVVILIFWAFANWRLSLLSLAPALVGLIWAAGVLALARVELDLFAVFAVVTFVGIGVDYGVHLVHRYRERHDPRKAIEELAPVILVAAAITLLGYGTLVMSSYPPLRSIGLVSIVAVVTLAVASVLVLPALLVILARASSPIRKP